MKSGVTAPVSMPSARRSCAALPRPSAILAPLLLGEFLSPIQAAGAGLVLLGIALAATR